MIKLAHIMPINNVELSSKGDIDFCLAPLCNNEQYTKYFIRQSFNGRHVILDNLIAENKPIPTELMVKIAFEILPTEFIIPDSMHDRRKTNEMRNNFLDKYYIEFKNKGIKLMAVAQGDMFEEYLSCFNEINNDERIDTIGIPFRMKFNAKHSKIFKDIEQGINRIKFLDVIRDKVKKPVHCLGCNSVNELIKINRMSFIRSCDSKLICRYALDDKQVKDENMKPDTKVIMEKALTETQIALTNYNILRIKEIINGKS